MKYKFTRSEGEQEKTYIASGMDVATMQHWNIDTTVIDQYDWVIPLWDYSENDQKCDQYIDLAVFKLRYA